MDGLTGWDWFVLMVVGLSMLFGLIRGLIKTVFALAAWGVAIVATPITGLGFGRGLIIVAIAAVIARQTGMDDSDSWRLAMTRPLLEQLSSWADFGGRQSSEPVRQT